eukprot:271134-Rhodomonas_salina.1
MYTAPDLVHSDPSVTATTADVPLQTSPGGQSWHSSEFGLRMYCHAAHGRHCCSSLKKSPSE